MFRRNFTEDQYSDGWCEKQWIFIKGNSKVLTRKFFSSLISIVEERQNLEKLSKIPQMIKLSKMYQIMKIYKNIKIIKNYQKYQNYRAEENK